MMIYRRRERVLGVKYDRTVDRTKPNNSFDRSAASEFVIVEPMLHAAHSQLGRSASTIL